MSKRPNILLVTGDHTRHDAVACNLNENRGSSLAQVVKTPNFDRLATEGVTFRNSFTPNPICVPGRASIVTGRYSHKCTGLKSNGGRIHDNQAKLAEHFNENGYATCAIGKMHFVPYSPPGEPRLLHGFQHAELCEEGRIIGKFDPKGAQAGLEDYHDYLKEVGWDGYERAHGIGNNDVHPSPSAMPAEYHEEAWVADRSIAWLEKHRQENPDQPFLIWSSFIKPHSPYDPPRPYDSMYDPREMPEPLGGWDNDEILNGRDRQFWAMRARYGWDKLSPQAIKLIRAYYCGMMSFQDAMLGRLLEYLDKNGLAENTIVVYSADHGDMLGDFGRFFKTNMYDGSVMVPLLIRTPELKNDAEHCRDQLAGLQDVFPTLCGLSGIPVPENLDGMDLTAVLNDPQTPGRDYYISQSLEPPTQKYMVRTDRWKYIYTEFEGIEELYDVTLPDYELINLADSPEHTSIKTELHDILLRWCQDNGDEKMLDGDKLKVSASCEYIENQDFVDGSMGWRRY